MTTLHVRIHFQKTCSPPRAPGSDLQALLHEAIIASWVSSVGLKSSKIRSRSPSKMIKTCYFVFRIKSRGVIYPIDFVGLKPVDNPYFLRIAVADNSSIANPPESKAHADSAAFLAMADFVLNSWSMRRLASEKPNKEVSFASLVWEVPYAKHPNHVFY